MPSLLWTGLQKLCLDQTCFILNMIWDFTSPLRELQGMVHTELLSLNFMCFLTWLCPKAWLSSTQGAETGGHWGSPNTVWEELEKNIVYKCICISALFATYCNVLQQDKKGCWQDCSFDGILLSTHLPHFSKLLWPENTGSAVGSLPWPGAVYRESHLGLQLSFYPKTFSINREVSTKMSPSLNMF